MFLIQNFVFSLSGIGFLGFLVLGLNGLNNFYNRPVPAKTSFTALASPLPSPTANPVAVTSQPSSLTPTPSPKPVSTSKNKSSPTPTPTPISTPTPTPVFTPTPTPTFTPTPVPNSVSNTFTANRKIMLLIFNPLISSQSNRKLTSVNGWNDPDQLTNQYINDVKETSRQAVQYQVSLRQEVNDYPVKNDGFKYTEESYLNCWNNHNTCHSPDGVNYQKILADYQVCEKLNNGEIDELWLFGGPWFGYWEANMAGPGAFNTNGPVIEGTSCQKKLHIMGFNYERSVSEMIEDLGHRVEGTMSHVYGGWNQNGNSTFDKFTWLDKHHSGQSACGNVHYAPNSDSDYDWGNSKTVTSSCEDWLNYPNLTGAAQSFNCNRWNCDGYQYKKWWLSHLPHADGSTDGKFNNWWKYIIEN